MELNCLLAGAAAAAAADTDTTSVKTAWKAECVRKAGAPAGYWAEGEQLHPLAIKCKPIKRFVHAQHSQGTHTHTHPVIPEQNSFGMTFNDIGRLDLVLLCPNGRAGSQAGGRRLLTWLTNEHLKTLF